MQMIFSKKELKDIFEWDVDNWSKALDFWKLDELQITDMKVLTIGERNGGLTLLFSLMNGKVTSTDLNGITNKGKELHKSYKVDNKVEYKNADILKLPYENNYFDIVSFKSVLGGLRDRNKQTIAVDEIYRVLKPGGILYFAENLKASKLHQLLRKKFVNWGDSWLYLDYDEKEILFSKFKTKDFSSYGFLAIFGYFKIIKSILSYIDQFINPIISSNKRYILFGKCIK